LLSIATLFLVYLPFALIVKKDELKEAKMNNMNINSNSKTKKTKKVGNV
jgi:hypothetical protein